MNAFLFNFFILSDLGRNHDVPIRLWCPLFGQILDVTVKVLFKCDYLLQLVEDK